MVAASLLWASVAGALGPGDFDPAFGSGGSVFYPWGLGAPPSSGIDAIALQPDGKIVLGGYATDANGDKAFLVARLGADGAPDPAFRNGGTVRVQLGSPDQSSSRSSSVDALAIQQDGRILAGGAASRADGSTFLVARLTADGQFDSSFGESGTVALPASGPYSDTAGPVTGIALQDDGRIVASGGYGYYDGPVAGLVTRLIPSGGLDTSFGKNGLVVLLRATSGGRHTNWGQRAVAVQPDGRIIVAGYGSDPSDYTRPAALVLRLDSTGSLDPAFGDDGMVFYQPLSTDDPGRETEVHALAVQADGRIVLGGYAYSDTLDLGRALVVRLDGKDGSFDPSFADGGVLLAPLGSGASPQAAVEALALQPDGKIVLAGWATDSNGTHELMVARLGLDGSLDPGFGDSGMVLRQLATGANEPSYANALALQPDTGIVAAGGVGSEALVARLLGEPQAPPSPPPPPGGTPPGQGLTPPGPALTPAIAALSQLRISPSAFAAADSGASIARRTGATVSYRDSQAATTTFTVLKPTRGVKSGGRCLRLRRGHRGRACTRWVSVGSFRHRDRAGANSFHFTGRIHHHKLAPGRYRFHATPRLAGRNGRNVTTSFRIVP